MFISGHFHVLGMRKTRKYISCVAIKKLERKVRKALHCDSKQQWRSPDEINLILLTATQFNPTTPRSSEGKAKNGKT